MARKPGNPLPAYLVRRMEAMNAKLYPMRLEYRKDRGMFRSYVRINGKTKRAMLSGDLETAYDKALLKRKEFESNGLIDNPDGAKRDIVFGEWHDQWREEREKKLAPSTYEIQKYYWKLVPDSIRDIPIGQITTGNIQDLLDSIDKPAAKDNTASYLSTCFNAAVKAGLLVKSPWSSSKAKTSRHVHVPTSKEIESLLKEADPELRSIMAFAVYACLRRGEIFALKPRKINLDRRIIEVTSSRSRMYGKNAGYHEKPTKSGKARYVPFPKIAVQHIEPIIKATDPDEYLYPEFSTSLPQRIATVCRRIGIPKISLHDLRHIGASYLIMNSGMAVGQQVLGHSDIDTTIRIYTHLTPAYLSQQVERAHFSVDDIVELKSLVAKFESNSDPDIQRLIFLALQMLSHIVPADVLDNKKDTHDLT